MCQCLEVGFGTVSEVISSQVHPLNCTKQGSSFNTAIMLKNIQFLNTVIEDDSNIVLASKETGIDCPEPAARDTDCENTGHATKEAVDDYKTHPLRETTGDDTAHAVTENDDDHKFTVVRETYQDNTEQDTKDTCDDLLHRNVKINGKSTVHASEHVDDKHRAVAAGETVVTYEIICDSTVLVPVLKEKAGKAKTTVNDREGTFTPPTTRQKVRNHIF